MSRHPVRPSLVDATETVLRSRIAAGRWGAILPGEARLCGELQVSRTTLRAALGRLEKAGIVDSGQGRRRAVKQAKAGKPPPGCPGVTLLVADAPERQGAFFLAVIDALRQSLDHAGLPLEVLSAPRCFSRSSGAELARLSAERAARLWVLWSAPEPVHRWLAARGLPHVVAGSRYESTAVEAACVEVDFHAVAAHAAGVLLSRGHRRLAVLAPTREAAGVHRAIAGFEEICRHASTPAVCEVLRHEPLPEEIASVVQCAAERKTSAFPTGWLVIEPRAALTLLTELLVAGKRVPEDLSILSADSDVMLAYARPQISRYVMSPLTYARWLGRQLLALHDGRRARDRALFPDWIKGASVAKAPGTG